MLNDSGMVARRAGYLRLINVASPDYLARYGHPLLPQELAGHVAVGYASPTTGRRERWEWEQKGEIFSTGVNTCLTVNNAEAYIAACVAGMGLIQIPEYDVHEMITEGALCEVMPDFLPRPLPVNILYSDRRHLSRPLRLFTEWLMPLLQEKMQLRALSDGQ